MKNLIKKKYKVIISFFLGMFVAGTKYFSSTEITYTNTSSTLSSTKVSCTANNFTCEVQKTGYVYCGTAGKSCYISSGTATCN